MAQEGGGGGETGDRWGLGLGERLKPHRVLRGLSLDSYVRDELSNGLLCELAWVGGSVSARTLLPHVHARSLSIFCRECTRKSKSR